MSCVLMWVIRLSFFLNCFVQWLHWKFSSLDSCCLSLWAESPFLLSNIIWQSSQVKHLLEWLYLICLKNIYLVLKCFKHFPHWSQVSSSIFVHPIVSQKRVHYVSTLPTQKIATTAHFYANLLNLFNFPTHRRNTCSN